MCACIAIPIHIAYLQDDKHAKFHQIDLLILPMVVVNDGTAESSSNILIIQISEIAYTISLTRLQNAKYGYLMGFASGRIPGIAMPTPWRCSIPVPVGSRAPEESLMMTITIVPIVGR